MDRRDAIGMPTIVEADHPQHQAQMELLQDLGRKLSGLLSNYAQPCWDFTSHSGTSTSRTPIAVGPMAQL
jgi:hypothetical protein